MTFLSWFDDPFMTDRPRAVASAASCTIVAVMVSLATGFLIHQPLAGMVAAGGAMSVGFGAFQTLGRSRALPMTIASLGMGGSAFAGTFAHTLAFHSSGLVIAALAGLWAAGSGLLSALGPGALWMGQQWVIAFLLAAAYPASGHLALLRAMMTLAGGLLQTLCVWGLWRFQKDFAVEKDPLAPSAPVIARLLRRKTSWTSPSTRYALRLAATVFTATAVHRLWSLPNGSWIPMTAVLVLKPDFNQTLDRARLRVIGTMVGAGLSTLLVATLRPEPAVVVALVILFAWLSYALQKVHYALFVMCLTSYIVFIFAVGGLPEKTVVIYRVLNTALGSALALIAYLGMQRSTWTWPRR